MPTTFEPNNVARTRSATYAPSYGQAPKSLIGAAFRMENDVTNLIEYLSRPTYEPDPQFNYEARAKDNSLFLNNTDSFIGIQSDAEWAAVEARLVRETEDRATIAAAGASGIAAAMFAGVLSPTILLPAGGAATAARVSTAAARTAAWTVAGASVQEAVLQANQETRTAAETAIGVGSAAVLGGLLGGAVRYIDPLDMENVASRMANATDQQAIQSLVPPSATGTRRDLSAQAVDDPDYELPDDVGKLAGAFGLEKATSFIGPITRSANSGSQTMRWTMNQFGTAGLYREGNFEGIATAEGGDLESIIKQHHFGFSEVNTLQKKKFREWYTNSGKGSKFRSYFPSGSYKEFAEEVGEALQLMSIGQRHTILEVQEVADAYADKVLKHMTDQAKKAGLAPWVSLEPETAFRLSLQRVRGDLARRDYDDFRLILKENALRVLQDKKMKKADVKKALSQLNLKQDYVGNLTETEIDDIADSISDQIADKMIGQFQRHGMVDVLNELGAKATPFTYIDPIKKWSNGRAFGEFLEKDAEKLSRSFIRSLGPDIEIYRRFGTVDPSAGQSKQLPFWQRIKEEQEARRQEALKIPDDAKRKKELEKIAKEQAVFERDLEVQVGRLRHTWGMPADPASAGHRIGRAALQLNTMRLMGSVVIASMADLARPILKYGFMNTMKDGLIPMLTDFKKFKMSAMEARYAGTALDVLLHGRSSALFDLFDELEYGSALERGMQYGTSRIGLWAGFDYWNTGLKMFSSSVANAKLARDLAAVAEGKGSLNQVGFLASVGITPKMAERMNKIIHEGGGTEVSSGVWMPNTQDWIGVSDEAIAEGVEKLRKKYPDETVDPKTGKKVKAYVPPDEDLAEEVWYKMRTGQEDLQRAYRAAIARLVDDTIITPGLERPNWVDGSTMGRLIGQFRSFTLSSTFKVGVAAAQEARAGNMAPIMAGATFSLALGAVSYYTWAISVGGKARERMERELEDAIKGDPEAIGRWADEAIARSGLLGVLSEAQKFAERTPGLQDYATFGNSPTSRSPFVNPVMETLGPSISLGNNLGRFFATVNDPTTETFRAGKQIMPYQNHFLLRQGFDGINNALMEQAGVSPR